MEGPTVNFQDKKENRNWPDWGYVAVMCLVIGIAVLLVGIWIGRMTRVDLSPVLVPMSVSGASTPVAVDPQGLTDSVAVTQLKENRQYNDRLIQIVLWSIGGTVGAASLLVGASIFNSYRSTQQEKESLKQAQEKLRELTDDFVSLGQRMASFSVRMATEHIERSLAQRDYQDVINSAIAICEHEDLEKAALNDLHSLYRTVRGFLVAVHNGLAQAGSGSRGHMPITVEPVEFNRLKEPVGALMVACNVVDKECLILIDQIAATHLPEEGYADDKEQQSSRWWWFRGGNRPYSK